MIDIAVRVDEYLFLHGGNGIFSGAATGILPLRIGQIVNANKTINTG